MKKISYLCDYCNMEFDHNFEAKQCEKNHRLENSDKHCDTCICDLVDLGWNIAENNDSHCPTCFCDKPIPKKYASKVFNALRRKK
jgi:hypothetical protein